MSIRDRIDTALGESPILEDRAYIALAVMLEPTDPMISAGVSALNEKWPTTANRSFRDNYDLVQVVFRAMIEEALKS